MYGIVEGGVCVCFLFCFLLIFYLLTLCRSNLFKKKAANK